MRRQDRERMRGDRAEQSRNSEDTSRPDRRPDPDQVKGGVSDEPRTKPAPQRQGGRIPLPD
jgi:hypothetical protein